MTKIVAFVDTVKFTADSLLPRGLVGQETRDLLKEYATTAFGTDDAKNEFRKKIKDSMNEIAIKQLASVGAELPMDAIKVNLEFGAFLYDLYCAGSPQPSAPLAQAAHQRRLQNMAARIDGKKEFTLKDEELAVIKKMLEDDSLWGSVKFNSYVEVKDDKGETKRSAMTLTTEGIRFYNKTLNAVVKLFEAPEDETKPAEQSADDGQEAAAEA